MSENPFENKQFAPQKQTSSGSNTWKWVLGILGGGGLLMVLLCCGGGIGLVGFGMNIVEEDLKNQLRDNPQIKEHIGEITKFDVNFVKSTANSDDDVFVYDVEGTNGSAELTIDSESGVDGSEVIRSASMRLPDGDVVELEVDAGDFGVDFEAEEEPEEF